MLALFNFLKRPSIIILSSGRLRTFEFSIKQNLLDRISIFGNDILAQCVKVVQKKQLFFLPLTCPQPYIPTYIFPNQSRQNMYNLKPFNLNLLNHPNVPYGIDLGILEDYLLLLVVGGGFQGEVLVGWSFYVVVGGWEQLGGDGGQGLLVAHQAVVGDFMVIIEVVFFVICCLFMIRCQYKL